MAGRALRMAGAKAVEAAAQSSLRTQMSALSLYNSLRDDGGGAARVAMEDRDPEVWPCDCAMLPTDVLSRRNPFPQDKRIRFVESTHKYYIDGEEAPTSTTSIVHAPFPHFDTKGRAQAAVGKPKYPGMSARQIARSWAAAGRNAANHGTTMHAAIEVAINTGYWSQDPRIQTELAMARDFIAKEIEPRGLEWFRTEPTVFVDPKKSPGGFVLPGSVDCLCRHPETGEVWVFDWKRVKGLDQPSARGNFGWGFPPFDKLENTKVSHYSLQLHVYRHILVHYYGFKIPKENLFMVAFHPAYPTYLMVPAIDVEHLVDHIMSNYPRYLEIAMKNRQEEREVEAWRDGPGE